ncbi:hypothetical protein [Spirosoma areae]
MKIALTAVLCCLATYCSVAQPAASPADTLPFRQIPDYPPTYTAKTILVRMIDGLGFRYYWATNTLTDRDLAYKPNEKARTTEETIDHILGLSAVVVNAMQKKVNTRSGEETSSLAFATKRQRTLQNLKLARDLLLTAPDSLETYAIVFQNGTKTTRYPVWNLVNGPLEDALWHIGQVVSFRRSSGNPVHPKLDVMTGKVGQ